MRKFVLKAMVYLSVMMLLFITVPSVNAEKSFTDIDNSYAKDAILELVSKGIISGDDVKFNPTANINRQDFAIILAKSLNLDVVDAPKSPTFSDVPASHYSYQYVEAAVKAGLIAGAEGRNFGVDDDLTREAMATMFVKALDVDTTGYDKKLPFSDAGDISSWAKEAVGYAVETKIMSAESNKFNPQGSVERQQVAQVASSFLVKAESLGIIPPTESTQLKQTTTKKKTTVTKKRKVAKKPAAVQPPAEQPRVEQSPAEQAPVEQPPAEQAPVDQPPAEQAPVDQPPTEQAPVDQPPAEQAPVDQPPTDQPPNGETPCDQSPGEEQWPCDQPPGEEQPSSDQPPGEEQPPCDQPPAENPPCDQPPIEENPCDQPPSEQPPCDQPQVDTPPMDVNQP